MVRHADVVIAGGGPVGLALACALQDSGLSVMLIEAQRFPVTDTRAIAISYGSRLLLERLGAWSALADATPIDRIHVSQRGGFGRTLLTAQECRLPALGYVARYDHLQQSLAAAVRKVKPGWLQCEEGLRLIRIDSNSKQVSMTYNTSGGGSGEITAALLILADGGSIADSLPSATIRKVEFDQHALVALVRAERMQPGIAYERFAPEGPIALLPFEDRLALVWSTSPQRARSLATLLESEFLLQLHNHYGDRLGRFTSVCSRAVVPLVRRTVSLDCARVALIGNAAQTLHPVAGQGFNLGLRDAWEIAQFMVQRGVGTSGEAPIAQQFECQRWRDRYSSVWFTDSLIHLFSNEREWLRISRGMGIALFDLIPPLRRAFAQRMAFGIRTGQ